MQKTTMNSSVKVQTSFAAFVQDSVNGRFSAQNKYLDLSSHYQHHLNKADVCKSNQLNNTPLPFTPPPSPSSKNKLQYSQRNYTENRSKIETLADELIGMFEQTVQQCATAEYRYKKLDIATKFTLNLQTKTYKHCFDELNKKVEKLEAQSSPHPSVNDDFLSNLIEGYTFDSEEVFYSDNTENHANESSSIPNQESQTEALEQQISATEQSMQQIIAHYVSELETERLQAKKLNAIIAKQDNLISKLEAKLKQFSNQQDNNDDGDDTTVQMTLTLSKHEKLLEAQIELQGLELEDKERLLSMLLDERDKLCIKVDQLSQLKPLQLKKIYESATDNENQAKNRSSIDILAKIIGSNIPSPVPDSDDFSAPKSLKKSHLIDNHSPPPPSRPPKNPLPPTPSSSFERSKPSRPISTEKSQKLSVNQHQSGVESRSSLDLEEAKNSNASYCYKPPSSEIEKPIYQHTQGSHEWKKHLAQELTTKPNGKIIEQPTIDINHRTNGFSSLLKNWQKHAN